MKTLIPPMTPPLMGGALRPPVPPWPPRDRHAQRLRRRDLAGTRASSSPRSPPNRSRTWSCAVPGRSAWPTSPARSWPGSGAMLADAGVVVSAIGSPIGKIPGRRAPLGPELDRMRRVAATGPASSAPRSSACSRSSSRPGNRRSGFRAQVIDRMAALAEIAAGQGLVLGAREREGDLRGHSGAAAPTLITSVNSTRPAGDVRRGRNFVQCGVRAVSARPTGCSGRTWSTCRSRTPLAAYRGGCAGGPGRRPGGGKTLAALRDSGFAGFMSLETAPRPGGPATAGSAGPRASTLAARSLKLILNELGISWR